MIELTEFQYQILGGIIFGGMILFALYMSLSKREDEEPPKRRREYEDDDDFDR